MLGNNSKVDNIIRTLTRVTGFSNGIESTLTSCLQILRFVGPLMNPETVASNRQRGRSYDEPFVKNEADKKIS